MLKKLFQSLRLPLNRRPAQHRSRPAISARQHPLQPRDISENAVSVVERLQKNGHEAYVVGGCIRDLLLDIRPKDYDVATSATPEQVRNLFRNAHIIGRRFRLVHVQFGREVIEVATFRTDHKSTDRSGRILSDNSFGSLEDDAWRRDFTINALYYDPLSGRILDHTHGLHDIHNRLIRLIGTPEQRYQEDPVRMLRAVRFAAKLDFDLEYHSARPIRSLARLLNDIPASRLFDEALKLFLGGHGEYTLDLLLHYDLFAPLFPATATALQHNPDYTESLIRQALANTDERIAQGKPVTPAFLFAALLWPALPGRALALQDRGLPPLPAIQQAAHDLIWEQCQRTAIPKRFSLPVREIWDIQERLPRRQGRRADQLLGHPRFRAGYDLLLLRESAGEQTGELGQWWTLYQEATDSGRRELIRELGSEGKRPRRGGRRPDSRNRRTD